MNVDFQPGSLLDRLNVGLSVVTYYPGDMTRSEWVFANETRARMVGLTREELMSTPPYRRITRAARTVPTAETSPPAVITRLARDVDARDVDARDVDARDGSPAA